MQNSTITLLNRRLGESLGLVCGGTLPRFAWKYAPDEPWFTFASDNRTLVKRCWADAPGPGGTLGKVWLLAEWRQNKNFDHFGFEDGVRIPVVNAAGYAPYFESALAPSRMPTEALNQNFIWMLRRQLAASAEHDPNSMENHLADEKYDSEASQRQHSAEWEEMALGQYDQHVGAFGNTTPGDRGGWMSFGGL